MHIETLRTFHTSRFRLKFRQHRQRSLFPRKKYCPILQTLTLLSLLQLLKIRQKDLIIK